MIYAHWKWIASFYDAIGTTNTVSEIVYHYFIIDI